MANNKEKERGKKTPTVSGDCSAKRPHKSPVCGAEVAGQSEGNNRGDEVGVLCEGEVSGGSSNVRNIACARNDACFGDKNTQRTLQCELEKLEPHAREKFARVNACLVRCTVRIPVAHNGNRHFLRAKLLEKNGINGSPLTLRRSTKIATDEEEEGEFDHVCQFHCRSAR